MEEKCEMSLYFQALCKAARSYKSSSGWFFGIGIVELPVAIIKDFCDMLLNIDEYGPACSLLSDAVVFDRLLLVEQKYNIIHLFQKVYNYDTNLVKAQYDSYIKHFGGVWGALELLRVSKFLCSAGLYQESLIYLNFIENLMETQALCQQNRNEDLLLQMEFYQVQIQSASLYCDFKKAGEAFIKAKTLLEEIKDLNIKICLVPIYCSFSVYYSVTSNFDLYYKWVFSAMQELTAHKLKKCDIQTILNVFKEMSIACVVKRKMLQAGFLIREAVNYIHKSEDLQQKPIYFKILSAYGYFLLNSDLIDASVKVYTKALEESRKFIEYNIMTALAYEELAYVLYVKSYRSGKFSRAESLTKAALDILEMLVPEDHFLLVSVMRIKLITMEERCLFAVEKYGESFSIDAEHLKMHTKGLNMCLEAFGEGNVQTAKWYGNLGRFYQTIRLFDESEEMQKKAIAIKESILGPFAYEVGLSVGHLASLYAYNKKKHEEAEELYFRSIDINLRLFGPAYTGLEYDYKGLLDIAYMQGDAEDAIFYQEKLREWRILNEEMPSDDTEEKILPFTMIVDRFFELEKEQARLDKERALIAHKFKESVREHKKMKLKKKRYGSI